MASALLADEHDPVGRAGDRAADVDQVALRVDLLDPEVRLGVTLGAVVARHLLALDDARRVRAGSDGARATVLRVAVVFGPPPKLQRFTTPWKPRPLVVPVTFTWSPGAKIPTVILSPRLNVGT